MSRKYSFILLIIFLIGILIPTKANAAALDSKAGIVTLSSGRLNIRSGRSTNASVVARINDGSYITLLSKSGSWWHVEYGKNAYGYCHADYITSTSSRAATVSVQSGRLNIRSGAGTNYNKIGTLANGEVVIILSNTGNWSRILYHGSKTGYVSTRYLSSSSYASIKLNVPNYKQTDTRWSSTVIGSSGKTIGKIGCTTTAIAMIESYRSGTTIYPNAMAKKLNYTASGNVYWPSDYTPVTSSADYLSKIYAQLSLGKPVLFGAKNVSGGQHWVVITGYQGGSSLTPSAFTINDPGSSSRTTLQQFLNAYPNFYKYFTVT